MIPKSIAAGRLSGLLDVNITNPQDNDILTYNAATGKWINSTGSGSGVFIKVDGTSTTTNTIPFQAGTDVIPAIATDGTSSGGNLSAIDFRDAGVSYGSFGMSLGFFGVISPLGVFLGKDITNYILVAGGGTAYVSPTLGHAFTGPIRAGNAVAGDDTYSQFGSVADIFNGQTDATDRLVSTKSEIATSGTIRAFVGICEFTGVTSATSGKFVGVTGYGGSSSASTQNITSTTGGGGIIGVVGRAIHKGSGTASLMSGVVGIIEGNGSAVTDAFNFTGPAHTLTPTAARTGSAWFQDPGKGTLRYIIRCDALGGTGMQVALGGTGANSGVYYGATTSVGSERTYSSAANTMDIEGRNIMNIRVNAAIVAAATSNAFTLTAASVVLAAGTTTLGPLKFISGTNLTTAVAGTMEYNGTNLFFTRAGTTREGVMVGNVGGAAPTTSAIGVVVDYYGTSATRVLTTPNTWFSVVGSDGNTYKVPGYS